MRPAILFLPVLLAVLAAPSGEARTCRILFLAAPDDAPEKLHLFDGSSAREVELPRMNLSPVYQLAAGDVTLRLLPEPPPTADTVDPRAPSARIAAGVSDCYLLVSPDPSNPVAPVSIQVIDASPDKLRKGQMLWFNLGANQVGGKIGSRQLAMKANSRAVIDAPATGHDSYHVNLTFRIPGDERLFPLCETKWLHDPSSRTVFFIITEKGNRTPRILGFPDTRIDEGDGARTSRTPGP